MITEEVYRKVRNGICAVGYLTEPLAVYQQNSTTGIFQVLGTGFLIEREIVLTNRHVVGALFEAKIDNLIPESQLFIQFVAPNEVGSLKVVPRMIREISYLDNPKLDVGFLKYKTVEESHFSSIAPLMFAKGWNLRVSESVGVCGYPYGTKLLSREHFFRWGPVLQQGHISAVSPIDTTGIPDEILLDVRTAPGMSGAPIFRPENGEVIGVHYAGIEATIAFGVPLIAKTVQIALSQFEKNKTLLNEG